MSMRGSRVDTAIAALLPADYHTPAPRHRQRAVGRSVGFGPPAAASPPDDTSFTAGATLPLVSAMIAQVGDDSFATMDVTSLLASSSASPTQHYGPFPSGSPDSGTCGNDWAQ